MKKNILFLISCFLDGGIDTALVEYLRNIPFDRYNVTLAIGMKMEGMEVHLNRIPDNVKIVYLVDQTELVFLRKRKLRHRISTGLKIYDQLLLNPIRLLQSRLRLKALAKNANLIVDFDATFYTLLNGLDKPIVGFYHFSIEENLKRSERHTRRQMHGMGSYTAIAMVSDIMLTEGKILFPELAERFVRIYNGYNIEEFRQRGDMRPPTGFPERYLVAVERLEESQKDLTTLIRAYAKATRSVQEYQDFPSLVIVGDGRDRERLQAEAVTEGVEDKVIFTGFLPDVAPIIKHSLGLLHSSKYEGFGLVLAEALILGKAVISTDTPSGPAELLDYGRAGELVAVGDVSGMAEKILRLVTEPEWRNRLETRGSVRGEEFDIHRSIMQLLKFAR